MSRSLSRVMFVWSAVSLLLGACGGTEFPEPAEPVDTNTAANVPIEDCPILPMSGAQNYPTCQVCGDGVCDGNEGEYSCPQDCTYCGDGVCNGWESTATCTWDCGSRCGDGTCNGGESVDSCREDCGPKLRGTRLHKVRYCRNGFPLPCNSTQSRDDFHWWDDFGVAQDKQKRTYIAQPLSPPRENVRHLVFISAGQQDGDASSGVTGQQNGFKGNFDYDSTHSNKWVGINSYSLASMLVEYLYRNPSDTFMGLAFDARFNYGFSNSNKQEIENAYYEWLKEKAYVWNLQSIYLAGHSRGGCLVARLARRFKQDFPSIPLIVHTFDGVCHVDGEFGVQPWSYNNPIMNEGFAYSSDIGAQFSTTQNLAFYNMVSGAQVLTDLADHFAGVHAFGYNVPSSSSIFTVGDWYTQHWFSDSHMNMSQSPIYNALNHYRSSCNRFGC